MSFRKLIPEPVKVPVREARRRWRLLKRSWANARSAFRPDEFIYRLEIGRFGRFEVAYRKGTADEEVIGHSFDRDIFFVGAPEYRPEPNHVILDVGAHIGTFSLLAASRVPQGKIYAVEASHETFNYLWVNIALNRAANIDASHLALSDKKGTAVLHYDEGNWGHTIMKALSPHGEEVATDSLASFMQAKGIERLDFIKFNCEGAEFPILLAAPPEVLQRIRMMLVLYHCDLVDKSSLEALLARLHESGFKTSLRNQDANRGWIVADRTGKLG